MSKWISVEDLLPPKNPSSPDRSIAVLICDEGSTYHQTVVSSYYDFDLEEWMNDYYKGRLEDSPIVSHWMPLPTADHPSWIDASVTKPKNIEEKVFSDGQYTKDVLICNRAAPNELRAETLIASTYNLTHNYWTAVFMKDDADDDNYGKLEVSHWMPLPAPPVEAENSDDDDDLEDDDSIFDEIELIEEGEELEEDGVELEEEEVEEAYEEDVYEDED